MEQEEVPPESEAAEKEKEPVNYYKESLEWFNEERLLQFATALKRYPALWRGAHNTPCNKKSAKGFSYMKLMDALALDPVMLAEHDRFDRAMALCRAFFTLLRQEYRSAAAESRSRRQGLALARTLAAPWAARADAYLNMLPNYFKGTSKSKSASENKKGEKGAKSSDNKKSKTPPSPPPCRTSAGARALRRVVRGMRRAAHTTQALNREAAAIVADKLGDTEDHVYGLWCSMRSLAMSKLRTLLSRGDVPPVNAASRLNARDWAVADLLLTYDCALLTDASFQQYEQLSALLHTFHLVQRFRLEPEAEAERDVTRAAWQAAARWYSRGRAIMSGVALQRRWHEMKQDTRWRLRVHLRGDTPPPPVLPLHQAIARRYGHIVTATSPRSWRQLVAAGKVAAPTSSRGPCPGEATAARLQPAADSSESDATSVEEEDDDDLIIVEKSIETIDLSEDEDETDEGSSTVKRRSRDMPAIDESSAATGGDGDGGKSSDAREDNGDKSRNVSRKNSNASKEIINAASPKSNVVEELQNLDASSLETTILFESDEEDNDGAKVTKDTNIDKKITCNIIESKLRKYLTQNTKSVKKPADTDESHNQKTSSIDSSQIKNLAAVLSSTIMNKANESNESRGSISKAKKRQRIESSDSADGNLVIDDFDSDSTSSNDASTQIIKAIEKEITYRENVARNRTNESNDDSSDSADTGKSDNNAQDTITKNPLLSKMISYKAKPKPTVLDAKSQEKIDKNPLLSQMIQSKSIFDDKEPNLEVNVPRTTKVYENKKKSTNSRYNRDTVSVTNLISASKTNVSETEKDDSNSEVVESVDVRRSSCDSDDANSNEENTEDTEGGFDPKLLMYPIVLLQRIENDRSLKIVPSPPKQSKDLRHLRHYLDILTVGFMQSERNMEQLLRCKPCAVMLERVDEKRKGSRVTKKVELPDIEEVRRNNRSMLTAQVAPLAQRQDEMSSPEATSSEEEWTPNVDEQLQPARAKMNNARSARRGGLHTRPVPCEDGGLKELLDNLAGCPNGAESCGHEVSAEDGLGSVNYDCPQCSAKFLMSPPTNPAMARMQSNLLKHCVPHTSERKSEPIKKIRALEWIRESSKKRRRVPSPSPSPHPRPRPRPAPRDPESDAREWLRQKNFAAEKFGVKPRNLKRFRPAGDPPPLAPLSDDVIENTPRPDHTRPQNRPAPGNMFNPDAVADINKKLGSLAENPPPEPADEPFEPVITCVQSLAPAPPAARLEPVEPPPSRSTADPVVASHPVKPKLTQNYVIIPAQNRPQITLLRPQGARAPESVATAGARTQNLNLPRVVDVAGGIRLPTKRSNDRVGLHLVVQNDQMIPNRTVIPSPTVINRPDVIPNTINRPNVMQSQNIIIPSDMIQNMQVSTSRQGFVISQQNNRLVLTSRPNTLLIDTATGSKTMLVSPMTGNTQSNLVFNHQQVPMVIRSVQSGPNINMTPQSGQMVVNNVIAQSGHIVVDNVTPQNDQMVVNNVIAQSGEMLVNNVTQQSGQIVVDNLTPQSGQIVVNSVNTTAQSSQMVVNNVNTANNAGIVPSATVTKQAEPVVNSESTATTQDTASYNQHPSLEYYPSVASSTWVVGRDPQSLCVLSGTPSPWVLGGRFVLVSAQQPPPPPHHASVWALAPRVRLELPDDDATTDNKRKKLSTNPEEPSNSEAKKPPWLRVKSFARIVDEKGDKKGSEAAAAPALVAPARVFLNDKIYQKLSDEPLTYAKLLVVVKDARAARQLLTRRAELQLYCLRTCKLYTLHAEPKDDLSRVTLSGDEEVSEALVSLARQLYQLPEALSGPVKRVTPGKEVRIAAKPDVRVESRPEATPEARSEAIAQASSSNPEARPPEQATITPSPASVPSGAPVRPAPGRGGAWSSPRVLNHDVNAAERQTEIRPQQTYRLLLGPQTPTKPPHPPALALSNPPRPPAPTNKSPPTKNPPSIKVTPVTLKSSRQNPRAPLPAGSSPSDSVIDLLSSDED